MAMSLSHLASPSLHSASCTFDMLFVLASRPWPLLLSPPGVLTPQIFSDVFPATILFLFLFFLFFFCFLGLNLRHMKVPRLVVELELQLLAYITATAMADLSLVCDLYHSLWQRWVLNLLSEAREQT